VLRANDAASVRALAPVVFDLSTQRYGIGKAVEISEALLARYSEPARLADPTDEFAFNLLLARIATEQNRLADARAAANAAKDAAVDQRRHRLSLPFLRRAYDELFALTDVYRGKERAAVIAHYENAAAGNTAVSQQLLAGTIESYRTWLTESQQLFVSDARDQLFAGRRLDGLIASFADVAQLWPESAAGVAARSFEAAQVRTYGRLTQAAVSSAVQSLPLDAQRRAEVQRFFNYSTQNSTWLRGIWSSSLAPSSDTPASGEALMRAITSMGAVFIQTGAALSQRVARVRQLAPELGSLMTAQAPPSAAVQALLRDDEALVATLVAADALYVWGITREQILFRRTALSDRAVRDLVRRVRASLKPKQSGGRLEDLPPFDAGAAHELYRATFGAVEPVLGNAAHVFWYGHDALGSVPPSILVTAAPAHEQIRDAAELSETPFLLDRFAVSVLADLSLLAHHRSPQTPRPSKSFIGIGAPLLTFDELERDLPRARSQELAGAFGFEDLAALPKLPESVGELKALASTLGEGEATLWLGPDAAETRLRDDALRGYRVIAFATHGFMTGEVSGLSEPALLLALPSERNGRFDGILTTREIASLRMDAQLVILSACNTASPDGRPRAEAFTGLSQAFFAAGARSLMVSAWPVLSSAAAELSVATVDSSAHRGLPLANGLRQAMQALRARGASSAVGAHPFTWGPFMFVGDGGRPLE
jgi:CHAT domain-containing protein